MRRGAGLVVLAAAAACARGPSPGPGAFEPVIRVGLVVDRDSATLSASGQFRVLASDGAILAVQDAGRQWRVEPAEAGRLRLARPDRPEPAVVAAPVTFHPETDRDFVVVGGRRYRGQVQVIRGSTGITVVNRVPMESYLLSVVATELGFRAAGDRQAVMAQAVAARTYAIRFRGRREALGFDVFPTDADQVYTGATAESAEVTDAVRRTTGQILTFRGEPIQALFHSTCGWSTEAADQVFQNREPVPYLRPASDRSGRGENDFYCSISPRFRWREEWTGESLSAMLAQTLSGVPAPAPGRPPGVRDIRVARTSPTGRVAELVVVTSSGEITVPRGRIREVLRPAADRQLLSTMFQLHVERRDGALTRVVAAGGGYGHGVGMCQFGAVGRARAGREYHDILATYYHGTRLERAY